MLSFPFDLCLVDVTLLPWEALVPLQQPRAGVVLQGSSVQEHVEGASPGNVTLPVQRVTKEE